jgi:hypothetical protein
MSDIDKEFLITEERLNLIATTFKIPIESVKWLYDEFCSIEKRMKERRLAHISFVLEDEIKRRKKNPKFIIEYVPYAVKTLKRRGSMSRSLPEKFTIYYDDTLPEKDIRVNISHELGHLYMAECYKESHNANIYKSIKFEETTEPLSTIFGIFTVLNKNHFYNNLDTLVQRHNDWESVLKDFKNLNS